MANFRKLVVCFGEKLENNEISKKIFKGGHSFICVCVCVRERGKKKKGVIY
jgi:hypothetical protein